MKKFLISAAILSLIAAVAVAVLNVSRCQSPDQAPDPSTTVAPLLPGPDAAAPGPDAAADQDALFLVQSADSGEIRSSGNGKVLLTLSGVTNSVTARDGSLSLTVDAYVSMAFKEGSAEAVMDYEESRSGPVRVVLSDPRYGEEGQVMLYEMDLKGSQVLSKISSVTLSVGPF